MTRDKVTVIGPTIVVRGKLRSDEDLVIQGRIEAEIASTRLVHIEKEGVVKADVRAESVLVSGLVVGNVTASGRLEITAEGRVVGNVSTPILVLQEGARMRGTVDMPEVEAAMAAPRPEPVVELTRPKLGPLAPKVAAVPGPPSTGPTGPTGPIDVPVLAPAPRAGRRTSAPPPVMVAALEDATVSAILETPPLGTQPMASTQASSSGPAVRPSREVPLPLTDAEAAAALDIPEIEILDEVILSVTTPPE